MTRPTRPPAPEPDDDPTPSHRRPRPGERALLVEAARRLLEGLTPEERARAVRGFCPTCGHPTPGPDGAGGSYCCD